MNRSNRYCCLVVPCEILKECNYFELELQSKDLKQIVTDINKEINTNFSYENAIINENYGILIHDDTNKYNQYIKSLLGQTKNGSVLLISHIANLDEFLRTPHFNEKTYDNLHLISHNSILAKRMLVLCMNFISKQN